MILFCIIAILLNYSVTEAMEFTIFGLTEGFWGALFGAFITGLIAIFIMNYQHRNQERRDLLNDENTFKTTKYFLKNRNNFQSIKAFLIIKKAREAIEEMKETSNQKEEIKMNLEFYNKNEEVIALFIAELHEIRKDLIIYISNKIIDGESIKAIEQYTSNIDSIIHHYNNLIRFKKEDKIEFQIHTEIIELINSIYEYETYIDDNFIEN